MKMPNLTWRKIELLVLEKVLEKKIVILVKKNIFGERTQKEKGEKRKEKVKGETSPTAETKM